MELITRITMEESIYKNGTGGPAPVKLKNNKMGRWRRKMESWVDAKESQSGQWRDWVGGRRNTWSDTATGS